MSNFQIPIQIPTNFQCPILKKLGIGAWVLVGIYLVLSMGVCHALVGFVDVPVTHPQYQAIIALQRDGVLSGYEDGTFKPERIVTRAEMVKLALNGAGTFVELDNFVTPDFSDVSEDDWFAPYVATAVSESIVRGFDDNTFKPNQAVNRVEALKMILTAQKLELPLAGEQIYKDVSPESWYAPYVRFVHDNNLLTVESDVFERDQGMRRKNIAEILYKLEKLESVGTLSCWPLRMLLPLAFLWALLFCLNLVQIKKLKLENKPLHFVIAILLAPLTALFYAFLGLEFEKLVTRQENSYHPSKYERLNYLFRKYVYIRHSRQIREVFLNFLKANYARLLYLFLILTLDYFVCLLLLTSMATCAYKGSLMPINSA